MLSIINKKAVLGVVAVAAMGFTTVIPSVLASAATTEATSLPANTSTDANDTKGSVSAKSDATVKVETGFLSLDAVPNLNFGEIANSTTAVKGLPLISNDGTTDDQGNDSGLLEVTDSRSITTTDPKDATKSTSKPMPWKLSAKLGTFTGQSDTAKIPTSAKDSDWSIDLKKTSASNTDGHAPAVNKVTLAGGGEDTTVISASDTNSYGSTSVYYNKAKDADLNMPANLPVGQYSAPITWTLQAEANSSANN